MFFGGIKQRRTMLHKSREDVERNKTPDSAVWLSQEQAQTEETRFTYKTNTVYSNLLMVFAVN